MQLQSNLFTLFKCCFLSNEDDLKTVTLLYYPTKAPYNNMTLLKPFSFDEELPLTTPVFVLIKCWFKRLPYDEINQAYVFILLKLQQICCSFHQSRTRISAFFKSRPISRQKLALKLYQFFFFYNKIKTSPTGTCFTLFNVPSAGSSPLTNFVFIKS